MRTTVRHPRRAARRHVTFLMNKFNSLLHAITMSGQVDPTWLHSKYTAPLCTRQHKSSILVQQAAAADPFAGGR